MTEHILFLFLLCRKLKEMMKMNINHLWYPSAKAKVKIPGVILKQETVLSYQVRQSTFLPFWKRVFSSSISYSFLLLFHLIKINDKKCVSTYSKATFAHPFIYLLHLYFLSGWTDNKYVSLDMYLPSSSDIEGCNQRSIFWQSFAGLNSEFSFS